MKQNHIVVKSNTLINASYKLSLMEQRILLSCIAQIDSRSDTETTPDTFTVSVGEIADLVGRNPASNLYDEVRAGLERLARRWIVFSETGDKDQHLAKIRWVSRIDYWKNDGNVGITFSKDVLGYLTQLKGTFTQYKLEYVAQFRNIYSIRIYELLIQWLSTGTREINIDELREKLVLGNKYASIKDMKKYVIDAAVNDIRKYSNIWVEYGQRKNGRKVVAFQFRFHLKDKNETEARQLKRNKMTDTATSNKTKKSQYQYDGSDARPGESWNEYLARKQRERK